MVEKEVAELKQEARMHIDALKRRVGKEESHITAGMNALSQASDILYNKSMKVPGLRRDSFLKMRGISALAMQLATRVADADRNGISRLDERYSSKRLPEVARQYRQIVKHKDYIETNYSGEGGSRATLTTVVSILGLLGGIFFLSSKNFAGSDVQLSPGATPFNWQMWLGVVLVIISLVSGYFFFRNKRKANSFRKLSINKNKREK